MPLLLILRPLLVRQELDQHYQFQLKAIQLQLVQVDLVSKVVYAQKVVMDVFLLFQQSLQQEEVEVDQEMNQDLLTMVIQEVLVVE